MPVEAYPFLSTLLGADCAVRPHDLKGLDAESRSVVLRRLLAEGVLVHAN
jgi:hypothetical protein